MLKFVRLMLLRPVERFLAQWISISTKPSAFVRERIRLGDTTNFLRASSFFLSAISTAFLAEVATLYLLGIGNLAELYYWCFVLLTSIPFVLACFLLMRFVAPLSFKDVLHLSFYPIGAAVFAGAALALVTSAVVALLVAIGYIPQIKHDFANWWDANEVLASMQQTLLECQKEQSILYRVLLNGPQDAYYNLKFPLSSIGLLRPLIAVLYFIVAARVFMVAIDRRRWVVFTVVLFAALFAIGAHLVTLGASREWAERTQDAR